MLLTERSLNEAQMFLISGRFDQSGEFTLGNAISKAREAGCGHIMLSLEQVSWIDSSGIGIIFLTYHELRRKGIRLSLINPKPAIRQRLDLVDIPRLIPTYATEEEAASAPTGCFTHLHLP